MGIESFPEMESFNKLPRQVLVKGGGSSYDRNRGAVLHGIVINNGGHTVCDLRVNLVVFDKNRIPALQTSTAPETALLPQGGISAFTFEIKDYHEEITDYHLFATWKFYDRE